MKETLVDIFDEWFQSRMRQVHTCLPGKIVSYNETTRKAVIKLLVQFRMPSQDKLIEVPPIDNVPVMFPGSKYGQFIFPLNSGDGVMVHFSEEGIGTFLNSQGTIAVAGDSLARFSLTDAIAVPGLWSDLAIPKNPVTIKIDKAGNINLNNGTNGVARLNDQIQSTVTEDPSFWPWLAGMVSIITATPYLGLQAAMGVYIATNPIPSSLTGKITSASTKVKSV